MRGLSALPPRRRHCLIFSILSSFFAFSVFAQCQGIPYTDSEKTYLKTLFETRLRPGQEPVVGCGTISLQEAEALQALRRQEAKGYASLASRGPAVLPCLESLWERGTIDYPWVQGKKDNYVFMPPHRADMLELMYCIDKTRAITLASGDLSMLAAKALRAKTLRSLKERDSNEVYQVAAFLKYHASPAWIGLAHSLCRMDLEGWGNRFFYLLANQDPQDPVLAEILSYYSSKASSHGSSDKTVPATQKSYQDAYRRLLYTWHYERKDGLYFEGLIQTSDKATQVCEAFVVLHQFGRDDAVSRQLPLLEKKLQEELNYSSLYFRTLHIVGRDDVIRKYAEEPTWKGFKESEPGDSTLKRQAKDILKSIEAGQLDVKPPPGIQFSCP